MVQEFYERKTAVNIRPEILKAIADAEKSLKNPQPKDNFYKSPRWLEVRYWALKLYGRKCHCCGATPESGAVLQVDHIKPRSKHPELSLEIENLQILCMECNLGKSDSDDIDYRPKKKK